MNLTGANYIGLEPSNTGNQIFSGINPVDDQILDTLFYEATAEEVDKAVQKAEIAYSVYRNKTDVERAVFLEAIGEEIMNLGDALLQRCHLETALPMGRLTGERGRTVNQLNLFAKLLREGSWVRAKIDPGDPNRKPNPKPDIRQMQKSIGPVGIFGASNFPLAFSVAGGDTASALAAGCTVVIKAHPAHPGTSEMVGRAILKAAEKTGMPDGVCSILQGRSTEVGMGIVMAPAIQAIGFTGSFRGGKAIFDAANQRPNPIPVYAEMGSINPVFILPEALKERGEEIAKGLVHSLTLGIGQFCTNPGIFIGQNDEHYMNFLSKCAEQVQTCEADVMLTKSIKQAYEQGRQEASNAVSVELLSEGKVVENANAAIVSLLKTSVSDWLKDPKLSEEIFGPTSIGLVAENEADLLKVAKHLEGHLTATIHGTESDLKANKDLIQVLEQKVGRLLINGFPTGVEVGHAMVHGGPFPATTDVKTTSVGTDAIYRFSRPVCYQNFPQFLLPDALKDGNPLEIYRSIDGVIQKSPLK